MTVVTVEELTKDNVEFCKEYLMKRMVNCKEFCYYEGMEVKVKEFCYYEGMEVKVKELDKHLFEYNFEHETNRVLEYYTRINENRELYEKNNLDIYEKMISIYKKAIEVRNSACVETYKRSDIKEFLPMKVIGIPKILIVGEKEYALVGIYVSDIDTLKYNQHTGLLGYGNSNSRLLEEFLGASEDERLLLIKEHTLFLRIVLVNMEIWRYGDMSNNREEVEIM